MLGQRISELRIAFGWSQVELAKRLRVAKQTVSNWENKNIQPSIEMLVRIAKLFRVSTDYLLGLQEECALNVEGLPLSFIAHLSQIIDDYREKKV
jgi:transcriptional regulator with XRE-family HTH domain